jgi:hypothetical protein
MMRLFLCYDGEKSEEICNAVAGSSALGVSKNQLDVIPIANGDTEQIQNAMKADENNEAVWLIASDNPLPMSLKRKFLKASMGKIFALCNEEGSAQLIPRILEEIYARKKLLDDRKVNLQRKEPSTEGADLTYNALAETLATSCRHNLIIEIGNLLSEDKQPPTNRRLCQSMVALLKPPLPGVPVSGSVDVGVCLHIARDVYQHPNLADHYPPIEQNNEKKITNTNWESLFTLFYASFIYSGTTDIAISADTNDIVVSFKKKNTDNSGVIESDVRNTFDKLIARAEQHSGFWKAENRSEELVIHLHDVPVTPVQTP